MKSRRPSQFQWLVWVLLLVVISAGPVLAQDQNYPPPEASPSVQSNGNYPDAGNSGNYPDAGQAQNYPEAGAPADAQNNNGAPQERQDPPGRVARVQYMSGEVSMQPGGVNDWIAASTNRPLTTADRIWADKNSRAELNVGDGFLRMNSETSVTLTNVSDGTVQIELDQGTLALTVKHLERGEIYEVDTPNYAFTVMKPGVYRFDVYPNEDQSWVTVRSGYGEATGKGSAVRVNSGQQARFRNGNTMIHTAEAAPARDGFEDWARVRDQRLDNSLSARYVSPGVIGYQDLDNYGTWQNTGAYGNIWVPSGVPSGWAPYRYGHWAWIAPWGWTWVDDAPWGFAPFHYGRWVYYNNYWGWAPGPLGYWNPYYAPALVGWIGGPGFGIGFGFGGGFGFGIGINFGWFPLGWGEPFYPRYCGWGYGGWYRGGGWVSNDYLRNVNITNTRITNINNITNNYNNNNLTAAHYGNRTVPGAVTAAPKSAFTTGASINKVGGAVPTSAVGKGQAISTANVTPTRAAVLGGQAARTTGVPPASATNRNVVTHANPPARPASIQSANQATMARSNTSPTGTHSPGASPAANNTAANRPGAPNSGAGNRNTAPNSVAANRGGTPANKVARPPSAGGTQPTPGATTQIAKNTGLSSPATHTVPRPPSSNNTFARGTANTHPYGSVNSPASTNNRPTANANSAYHANTGSASVPRPPASYQYGHPASTPQSSPAYHAPSSSTPSYHAPSNAAPSHSNPAPSHSSAPSSSDRSGSGTSASVPRPPSSYSYRQAPTYSASANYGSPRSSYGSYGSRGSYPSASSSYGGSRNSYPSGGYSNYGRSAPSYSARSSSPYSGGHSSAPSSGGGSRASGGGYHASSGGGGGRSSGGGGGHSGGGGHR
jgi:hypothetical protein